MVLVWTLPTQSPRLRNVPEIPLNTLPRPFCAFSLGKPNVSGLSPSKGHENYDGVLDALVLPLLRHFHGRLQAMSCLTINIPVFNHNEETLSNMSFIVQSVPSIRELGLQLNRPSPEDMSHFTCSLTHLTRLYVRDTTVECVWYLLQRCPNLQTALFTLGSTLEPRRWSENTYDVCCNHLHTLSISYDQCYDREDPDEGDDVSNDSGDSDDYLVSSPFLDFISLPNLTNMTIGTAWSDDPYYHADPDLCYFTPLATRNSAGIQALTLDKFPAAAFEMEKLYHQLPNLRYLDIIEARWTDHGSVIKNYTVESRFLDAMKHTSIFPKLEELRLYVNHDWEGSSAFEEMVERRRFKNMYLEIRNRSVDNLDLPRLRELVAKGQMVTVKCESAIEGKLYTLV
ncbi:hypothetical protein VNI00_017891 [Paramarasmius palmivorus]|uniref:Uncharacterized protein n=1 Tax=Paramarasmius palmivorus TaxID=297713 RepID=A0AAW0B3C5_9AGAR